MKRSELAALVAQQGVDVWNRRTGKSLGDAFHILSQCLRSPGRTFWLEDHAAQGSHRREIIARCALLRVEEVISALGLKGFTLNRQALTLRYDVPDDTFEG